VDLGLDPRAGRQASLSYVGDFRVDRLAAREPPHRQSKKTRTLNACAARGRHEMCAAAETPRLSSALTIVIGPKTITWRPGQRCIGLRGISAVRVPRTKLTGGGSAVARGGFICLRMPSIRMATAHLWEEEGHQLDRTLRNPIRRYRSHFDRMVGLAVERLRLRGRS
jgi:hypothetical protein